MAEKSAYELERDQTIARNKAKLVELGLEKVVSSQPRAAQRMPKASVFKAKAKPTRSSKRTRSLPALAPMHLPDDKDDGCGSEEEEDAPMPPPKRRAPRLPPPSADSPLVGNVRRFVEENVPDDHTLEERKMFGMAMWMVRGNMFLGVGATSGRLLVRVGEPAVEPLLSAHPEGVRRCGSEHRGFPGTLMVEPEQFRGDAQLRVWFEHAMRHNATMQAKEPSAKPRKQKAAKAAAEKAAATEKPVEKADATAAERVDASAAEKADAVSAAEEGAPPPPPRPLPASTSGGAFARCVLHVVQSIPSGRVASYGQVAALVGRPRNSRQVGHLLKEGLCAGGMPWWRVLGASGKSSLPADAGGDTQRANLEAEGVLFRATGAVDPEMWWTRADPFFA